MTDEITVHGYAHSGATHSANEKPREPLVHILGFAAGGDLQSMSFHPRHAEEVCKHIMRAARAARRNKNYKHELKGVSDT